MSTSDSNTLSLAISNAVTTATAAGLDSGGIWRAACDAVVEARLQSNSPFSSGEIAAILRTFDPTLKFSVGAVGERLRDAFFAGEYLFQVPEITDYNDHGDPIYATDADDEILYADEPAQQITRYTEGLGRTVAGTMVFVYASTYEAGEEAAFEVDIPRPGTDVAVNPTTGVPDAPVPHTPTRDASTDDGPPAAQVAKATRRGSLRCTVQRNGRMNVGRPVLESYALLSRQGIKADTKVYVWVDSGTQTMTLRLKDDPASPAAKTYSIFRGRILINLNPLGFSRPAGQSYTANVVPTGIVISL